MSSQSNRHGLKKTRKDHSTEIAEDYVELIAELIETRGRCRVTELARRLGVSHVTASRTVGRLVSSGLAETSPHQPIRLTPRGKRMATTARARHELVFERRVRDPRAAARLLASVPQEDVQQQY